MKVDIFDFELDRSLIAKQPASPRDTSRLLDLSEEDKIADRRFYDLPDILRKGDVLVFNDTKVIPARLYGARGDARVEVTLYRPVDGVRWWSFVKMPNACTRATPSAFTPTTLLRKKAALPPPSLRKRKTTAS